MKLGVITAIFVCVGSSVPAIADGEKPKKPTMSASEIKSELVLSTKAHGQGGLYGNSGLIPVIYGLATIGMALVTK